MRISVILLSLRINAIELTTVSNRLPAGIQAANPIWSGIEVAITSLTRNQVAEQSARGFESHPLRHEPAYGQP